ncbi:hypothetical protein SteCoe_14140 [Stentor coeruleus]|uniref:Uncharacterized protein n=1 Tax=Stentor coeruleus TaxID=5963 RepID=A0A1R2C6N4_9CILI|nr:hypothetical protein SteCoe_14140 [Stentor coeruleus]
MARNKSIREFGVVIYIQTELTIDDITNNLRKSAYDETLDLDNIYDFLNTYATSKGKSGFVIIKRPQSVRKKLSDGSKPKLDDPNAPGYSLVKSPREKSSGTSPHLASSLTPKGPIRKIPRNVLKSIEERPSEKKILKKKSIKKIMVNKSELASPKSLALGKHLEGSSTKRAKGKDSNAEEFIKERVLSPYAGSIFNSAGKLPLLQNTKKRIKVLKYDKQHRKSIGIKNK